MTPNILRRHSFWLYACSLLAVLTVSTASEPIPPRISETEMELRARGHAAYAAGIVSQLQNDTAGMLELWTEAVKWLPDNLELAEDVARRRLSRQEWEPVIALLNPLLSRPDVDGDLHAMVGFAQLRLGRTQEAIGHYLQAHVKDPGDLTKTATLVRMLIDSGRAAEAPVVLETTEKVLQDQVVLLLEMLELHRLVAIRHPEFTEPSRARQIALLDRVEALNPEEPTYILRIAEICSALGLTDRAEINYRKVRERAPRNALAAARLAEAYLRADRLAEAIEELESLQRLDPTSPIPLFHLGLVALQQRDREKAETYFEQALLVDPENEAAHLELIGLQLGFGKLDEATQTLSRARARLEPSFRLEYLTALVRARHGDTPAALKAFEAAERIGREKNPEVIDHQFYFQVGAMLEQGGSYQEAVTYLQKSLTIEPDFDEALNHLGYMWAEKGENLERAHEMIVRALAAEPDNAAYLDSLGWVLFKLERFEEALPPLLKAVELMAETPDAVVLDHLGDVQSALGQTSEARASWEAALEAKPDDELKTALENKLNSLP